MRKDLTIYTLAITLGFVMGLFTCKTCTKVPTAAPDLKDTVIITVKDSAKTVRPEPVRVTVPELATGTLPAGQVLRIPYPVYIRVTEDDSCRQLYDRLYEDYASLKEYDNTYPFGEDTVRIKQFIQGNDLWEQSVYLVHAEKQLVVPTRRPRNTVWWGTSGYWREGDIGVGSNLMFVHKRGFALEAGAAIGTQGMRTYTGGVKWKIGK